MAPTCGPIPSVRLTKTLRQAQQSTVVTNTHWINQGLPSLTDGLRDFFLCVEDDTDNAAGLNVDVVARRIPRKFRLDPRRDVQVLAPVHRGPAGRPAVLRLVAEGPRDQI
jgi:exodeoxyribonuclease V alpha subunit